VTLSHSVSAVEYEGSYADIFMAGHAILPRIDYATSLKRSAWKAS